ncbi:hypothetical protein ASD74_17490 [Rhizobium sp. Root564]|nr:hypothetical protein ASD74_17490 [Rhizobium sp. Root564]
MIGMHPTIRQSFPHPRIENEDNEKDENEDEDEDEENQRRDLGAIRGSPTSPHLPTRSVRLASARARAASLSRLSSAQ